MRFDHRAISTHDRTRTTALRPYELRGAPAVGQVVKLMIGQGHGFIRLDDRRDAFFHRADLQAGTSINDLKVGDTVAFEHLDDAVSGARALRVRRAPMR